MTLKELPEIRHMLVDNSIEELNKFVAGMIADGWELLETKLVQYDAVNKWFVVFYIWKR